MGKNIVIENGVTSIGTCAFYACSTAISVTIPNSVTSIGESAFGNCSRLSSILLPNSVTSIGDWAFYECHSLTSINIPDGVDRIGQSTFGGCYNLTSISIPNSVTSIGGSAFTGCMSLTSINIPNSVTSIGGYAFEGTAWYDNQLDGLVYIGTTLYQYKGNMPANTNVVVKEGTNEIASSAFYSRKDLSSIVIPNTVTYIGGYAFESCNSLTFITCEANTPPSCGYNCFNYVNKSIPVYVPANSINAYKKADGWKDFTNIQAIVSYTLTDGALYTNNSQINGRDISYPRTFYNTNWQALYIPFSLNYNDWKDDFDVAYINGIRQWDYDDDGTIDETVMDIIKIKSGSTTPNMPYLIKAKTTGEKTFSVSNASLYPAEENSIDCSTTIAKYTFTGTYNTISSATMIANNYYAMGGGELIQSDGSNDLKPYRWYMKVESRNPSYNASNAAKTITINVIDDEGETTTGVEELQMTNYKSPVYDLNGRKVNENNLKPGIYVKNGKKFVVK